MDSKENISVKRSATGTNNAMNESVTVTTNEANIEGKPTRSKKDVWIGTVTRLGKSSFEPFKELSEALQVWMETLEGDMLRNRPRVDSLSDHVSADLLYGDAMLKKRTKVPFTLMMSTIKLFTSINIEEGPSHPVKKYCAEILYANNEEDLSFALALLETHEAISQSERRSIILRNEQIINSLSEQGINVSLGKISSLQSNNAICKPTVVHTVNSDVQPETKAAKDIGQMLGNIKLPKHTTVENENDTPKSSDIMQQSHGNEDSQETSIDKGEDFHKKEIARNVENDPDDDPDSSDSDSETDNRKANKHRREFKSSRRTNDRSSDDAANDKKISSLINRFKTKKDKFTGEFEEAWIEYETDYRLACEDLNINLDERYRLLHNLLDGEARRTYLRNVAPKANTFEEATLMMRDIYDTPAVQARITNILNMLQFDDCIDYSLDPDKQEVDALYKLHHKISTLAPQGSTLYREDGLKVDYLRRAVMGKPWANHPCSQISALDLKYIDLYQMLKESLQHYIEERKAVGSGSGNLKKVYHTNNGRKTLTPDKYGKITDERRPKPSHWRKSYKNKRSNLCHLCGKIWDKKHVCHEEDALAHTKKRLEKRKAFATMMQLLAEADETNETSSESSSDDGNQSVSEDSDSDIPDNVFETMFQNKMKHILQSQKH